MDFKKNMDFDFFFYVILVVSIKEIDFLGLLDILFVVKKCIIVIVFVFVLVGLVIVFLLLQKWISKVVIMFVEQMQWNLLCQMMVVFQVLDVDVKVFCDEVFGLFIKKFQLQLLFEEYMKFFFYVMLQFEGINVDLLELYCVVVNIFEKMKVIDNIQVKDVDKVFYVFWMFSFIVFMVGDV